MIDTDFDERLARHLRGEAGRIAPPPGTVRAVVDAARNRYRRRRAVAAVATVGAVSAGTLAAVHRPAARDQVRVKVDAGTSTSGTPTLVPSTMHWQKTATPASLLGATVHSHGGAPLYAVATAPGQAPTDGSMKQSGYTSSDGVTWTPIDLGDRMVTDLDGYGGKVYAVGTAAATAPIDPKTKVGDAVLLWREGTNWQTSVLPIDLRALAAKGLQIGGTDMSVAAGPAGVVVAVNVFAGLDLSKRLPASIATDPYYFTSTGVEVHSMTGDSAASARPRAAKADTVTTVSGPGPVIATYTYEQLGIDPTLAPFLLGVGTAFYSADGQHFEAVPIPVANGPLHTTVKAVPTVDGFALVTTSADAAGVERTTVSTSTDGRTWSASDTSSGYPLTVGTFDGRLAVVAGDGPQVSLVSASGVERHDLASIAREAVGGPPQMLGAAVGPTGIGVLVMNTGAIEGRGDVPTSSVPGWRLDLAPKLLESPDGVHWSVTPLSQLTSAAIGGATVIATDNAFVVTITEQPTASDKPATQQVFVGTR
jgi:hypothetical protein